MLKEIDDFDEVVEDSYEIGPQQPGKRSESDRRVGHGELCTCRGVKIRAGRLRK